jgi:hypothetical protein
VGVTGVKNNQRFARAGKANVNKTAFKIYDAAGSATHLRKKEICHSRQKL